MQNLMKFHRLLFVILMLFFFTACTHFVAYSGEPENSNLTATIKGVSPWFAVSPIGIVIKAVDGNKVSRLSSKVKVKPGQHQLDVLCYLDVNGQRVFTRHKLDINVEAGKLYYLSSRRSAEQCQVFLE